MKAVAPQPGGQETGGQQPGGPQGPAQPGIAAEPRTLRWWYKQPPGAFAFVMASGIVSGALLDAGNRAASRVLLWLALCGLVVLTFGLIARIITRPRDVVADFRNPYKGFGYLTMVAACNVVGTGFHPMMPALTIFLASASIPLWLFLAYGIPLSMMLRTEITDEADTTGRARLLPVDGTWFLWVVSTQSLAVAAATVAGDGGNELRLLSNVAVSLWGIGIMLYLTLTTMVVLRLLTGGENRGGIVPSNWIFMGATAITVLAGSLILNLPRGVPVIDMAAGTVGGISYLLWSFGLWWVPILVAFGIWRHIVRREPLRYATALWSIVFPLGMFSVATYRFGDVNNMPQLAQLGTWVIWVAVAAWGLVAAGGVATAVRYLTRR